MQNRPARALACFLVATLIGSLSPRPATAEDLAVEIHELGKERTRAQVKSFGDVLTLSPDRAIPWGRILALHVRPAPPPTKTTKAHWRAWLVGGEMMRGTVDGIAQTGDALKLDVMDVGPVVVSLDVLSALEFVPADAKSCHDLLEAHPGDKENDVAFDVRGDALYGTVLEVNAAGVAVEDLRQKEREVTWGDLRVLRLSNDPLPVSKAWGEVELANGTRLRVLKPPTLSAGTMTLRTRSMPDVDLRVSSARVRTIRWNGGAYVWASTLPFTSKTMVQPDSDPLPAVPDELLSSNSEMNKMFGVRTDRRVDRREDGPAVVCPLRVAGVTYRHGFSVHSHSEIRIRLDKAYTSFQCSFGIDDEVFDAGPDSTDGPPAAGDVDARILCDGTEKWKADSVKGGEKALRVGPIDVTGVTELVLIVGYGPDKRSTLDRADWLEPILVRTK